MRIITNGSLRSNRPHKNRLRQLYSIFIVASFLLFSASSLQAQETNRNALLKKLLNFPGLEFVEIENRQIVKPTLKATLQLVLEFNSTIQSALLAEEIATSALRAAEKRNNPVLNHSFSLNRTVDASFNSSGDTPPSLNVNLNDSHTLSSRLSQKVSKGVSYSATFSERTNQRRSFTLLEEGKLEKRGEANDPLVSSSLILGISVPIYQDWGSINEIPVMRSRVGVQMSKVSTNQTKLRILEVFARIYWDLAGLWKTRELLTNAITLAQQLVRENRVRLEAGVITTVDLKQSEIQLFRTQQQLLEIDNQIRTIEDQVKVALHLEDLPHGILPRDTPQMRQIRFQFKEELQKVWENSLELKALEAQIQNNDYDLQDALNQDAPDLDLNLSYTFQGVGGDFSKTFETYDQPLAHGYHIELTWSMPLFDHKTPELIKRKKLERTQLQIQKANLKDDLLIELKTIDRHLRFSEQDIRNAVAIRELAHDVLRQEIEKQELGQSTGFQVAQAQQELIAAQSSEIQSLINQEKIHLSLIILTGDIFEQFQIPR